MQERRRAGCERVALRRLPAMIGFHFLELYVHLLQARRQRFSSTALMRLVEKVDT
jgi:hypothetical protein